MCCLNSGQRQLSVVLQPHSDYLTRLQCGQPSDNSTTNSRKYLVGRHEASMRLTPHTLTLRVFSARPTSHNWTYDMHLQCEEPVELKNRRQIKIFELESQSLLGQKNEHSAWFIWRYTVPEAEINEGSIVLSA